jgi:DNA-binding GntR family transcriptional regulator
MTRPLEGTVGSQLAERIRERILTGEYAPGTPLLQDSIAAEFGVSKIPVREALFDLRAQGLIDINPYRGFQVRAMSIDEMSEVFRLRLNIEPQAIAIGARLAAAEDRAAAQRALDEENKAMAAKDNKYLGHLNAVFHLALIVPRLQPVTHEMLQRLYTVSERYVRLHLQPAGRDKRSNKEHSLLHEAWVKGNGREAQRLVRTHIEQIRDDLAKALDRGR